MKTFAASLCAIAVVMAGVLIGWRFVQDLSLARDRAARGSVLVQTRCGPIEYQETGQGVPLLVVHGSGGGHDQGMAFAGSLAQQGVRVIAMSRFGYLRTPMPADASPPAQADAHACLLDTLGIRQAAVLGGSAGAPSAMQLAIRHPERVTALILAVPITYRPNAAAVPTPSKLADKAVDTLLGSDFLFWVALQVARDPLIKWVMATPPELMVTASPADRLRVNALLDNILPLSARAAGLRHDTLIARHMEPYDLAAIRAPTVLISARDDGYGTYANAQYTASQIAGAQFVGFEQGGHLWIGHDEEMQQAILRLIREHARP